MGGASSRELEVAQSTVRRLTAELQKVKSRSDTVKLSEAGLAAAQKELRKELATKQKELDASRSQLSDVVEKVPKLEQSMQQAREDVRAARRAEQATSQQMSSLQAELRASKEELERVFGKLKFAETERLAGARGGGGSGEPGAAVAEKKATAEASARLVAEASAALAAEVGGAAVGAHPVYGELLWDFGHKRLYLGRPATLWAGTVLWERQRAFRQERATLIAQAKARSSVGGWPGSIAVVERAEADSPTGRSTEGAAAGAAAAVGMLIDGQHRLGAAHLLSQSGKLSEPLQTILVEVYPPMGDSGVKELFTEINRAEPVMLVDLPDGGASDAENATITRAAETLRAAYPSMFKPSQNCRPPHLNVDVLRSQIHESGLLQRMEVQSPDAFVEWLEARNARLAARSEGEWESLGGARTKSSAASAKKALTKAREHGLYLGLSWDWLREE